MSRLLYILLLSTFVFGCTADNPEQKGTTATSTTKPEVLSPQDIARSAFRSVVLLMMEDAQGQPLSLGSGFFVEEGLVATNYHVIRDAAGGSAKLVGQEGRHKIAGVVAADPEHDLALLAIDAGAPPLRLRTNEPAVGDNVYALGNPQGLEGTFSPGIVSSIRKIGSDNILQITAPISPGSSGGPVVNDRGEVVGVATATYAGGQNLNFAVPSSFLKSLSAASRTSPIPLAAKHPDAGKPSLLSRLGGGSASEGVVGDRLQWQGEFGMDGQYSVTLRNKLSEPVTDVVALVIFYDRAGEPLDTDLIAFQGVIPPGLGRRATGEVDVSVKRMTTDKGPSIMYSLTPAAKVAVRVLNFSIAR
jgi:hypothetical protein